MRSAGIICECNPLHEGHLRLLREAKRQGNEAVICVMSGCFTQRGEAAILEPRARAEALLASGADAVLELPFPYSSAGAEFFARAGVNILSRMGVEELWFGSESGDLPLLWAMAEEVSSPAFQEAYAAGARGADGTATHFFSLLAERLGRDAETLPNDILAVSYLRAIRQMNASLAPRVLLREGSGFHETVLTEGVTPSASALRKGLLTDGPSAIDAHLPRESARVLREMLEAGRAPAALCRAEAFLLGSLRRADKASLSAIAELSGGLGARLVQKAAEACTLQELLSACATKKYTNARILRGILFAVTGVLREDLCREPAYVRLLGATERGRAFLGQARRTGDLPLVTRQSDLPRTPEARRQAALEREALSLYALCLPAPTSPAFFLRQRPILL